MQVWVMGSESAGQAVSCALIPVLRSLVPALEFQLGEAEEDWKAVRHDDGALLCVTPGALAGEQLYFDLGRLQGAVGAGGFVAPVLLDLSPDDVVQSALAIFQCTRAQRDDLEMLVLDLQRRADRSRVPDRLGTGFDHAWDELRAKLDNIPGHRLSSFIVTLLLPERPVTFGFDGGTDDATWDESVGRALESLADSPIKPPPFDPASLAPLDVETSRWTELPRRLSRLQAPHLALVSPRLVEEMRGDARTLARRARDEVERLRGYGGGKVLPWKFMHAGDKLVLVSNVR